MLIVPRLVTEIAAQPDSTPLLPAPLSDFDERAAWVLLGEPGAGKTVAVEEEATRTGGVFVSIAEFLIGEPDEVLREKTLFLDGLDEVRASGDERTLLRLKQRLKQLDIKRFRISCRAADWLGTADVQELQSIVPGKTIAVLQLEVLANSDIESILATTYEVVCPADFVATAQRRGVQALLQNPQTLGLLARAVQGDQWPATRLETFEIACAKLAEEPNRYYRNARRGKDIPTPTQSLDAAGELCAALLLSDKVGIALDPDAASEHAPFLDEFLPSTPQHAAHALKSALFRSSGNERLRPCHRSIAEFLAARWIAGKIETQGLPVGRVLNLLHGSSTRTVSGLRGLYAWLALHSLKVRDTLIKADPLTVVLYGDVQPMSAETKERIFEGLREEARQHPAFRWQARQDHPFWALADQALTDYFRASLATEARDEASQSFVECIITALREGGADHALLSSLKDIVADDTWWPAIRQPALNAWLKRAPSEDALELLEAIAGSHVRDDRNELTGRLLAHLYPGSIRAAELSDYLHLPQASNYINSYTRFWRQLSEKTPDDQIPALLDTLAGRSDLQFGEGMLPDLRHGVSKLLLKGVQLYGESITSQRLLDWLGIGADEYGSFMREAEAREAIGQWLTKHPMQYKALIQLIHEECARTGKCASSVAFPDRRLHGATAPDDLGLWHLELAGQAPDDEARKGHIQSALDTLIHEQACTGLDLEQIEALVAKTPQLSGWVQAQLYWEIPEWRREEQARRLRLQASHALARHERSFHLEKMRLEIESGTAPCGVMYELACVWLGLRSDVSGKTPLEYFDTYAEAGDATLAACSSGFRQSPLRRDLPTADEIVGLALSQQQHFSHLPCLIGMDLRWQDGPERIDELDGETLARMLAFQLTDSSGTDCGWFVHLATERPHLVANAMLEYTKAAWEARSRPNFSVWPLLSRPSCDDLAQILIPRLLDLFPLCAWQELLRDLKSLLRAVLDSGMFDLRPVLERKLAALSMGMPQKVYWLTAAMLFDPARYEDELWNYARHSWERACHVADFFEGGFSDELPDLVLPARTLGQLIELQTPHSELEWEGKAGIVTAAMQRGDQVRAFIKRLSGLATDEALAELERLLTLPSMEKLKYLLQDARYQWHIRKREADFHFPALGDVVQILSNRAPANVADLLALAVDLLDDFAREIRCENDDGYRAFWNVENKKPVSQREENLCRDNLLRWLRPRLDPLGVEVENEVDYAGDKRADLRLSYRNRFQLPIEIKRDSNADVLAGLRKQLIAQYAIAPKAAGHGIYVVLWFDGAGLPASKDGGGKPKSPEELQRQLEASLSAEERLRIRVRVMDVSWPQAAR
ncbi:MAG: hypothetical protein PHW25_17870 [Zoogloea sp.]|uniref:NACHT domain-containing protein n=1 Tax=Zoogloea sp. TaxID=49181 RepID=UPI00262EE5ED|nr:hypothetical protein [Zoogloea sp.]MDD3328953.1 hypothetical protein [Zoogloea sp.]